MNVELVSTPPREAWEMWLDRLEEDHSEESVKSYHYRTKQFIDWCEGEGEIGDMTVLSGRDLQDYRQFRKPDLNTTTLQNNLGTLRLFLQWCVAIEAVEPVLPEKLEQLTPNVSKWDEARDTKLDAGDARRILDYLERFDYASRDHALFALLWDTGARISGIRGLDVEDFEGEDGYVKFRHREETPLKNDQQSERVVALTADTTDAVADYVREKRHSRLDDHGREPLLTTAQGRHAKTTIRRVIYRLTQPCVVGECPHDEDPETCSYREHGRESMCPSSVSPHPIRTGRITHLRDHGMQPAEVAERVDATPETLRYHYDKPEEGLERMENRREILNDIGV